MPVTGDTGQDVVKDNDNAWSAESPRPKVALREVTQRCDAPSPLKGLTRTAQNPQKVSQQTQEGGTKLGGHL